MVPNICSLIPLEREARTALPTAEAAAHLNRAEQTLRIWACRDNGPLRPRRVNGRLAWPVDEIKRLLASDSARDPLLGRSSAKSCKEE